jgi:hypothetical protein
VTHPGVWEQEWSISWALNTFFSLAAVVSILIRLVLYLINFVLLKLLRGT